MPKIHDVQQGSVQWLQLHVGKPTASEFNNLMTPEFKARDGETPKTYLCKKVAEAWRNAPLMGFSTFSVEQGQMLEEEALPWFEVMHDDLDLQRVGFVESDDGKCGCSPDGLIGKDEGLEVKCPFAETQVKYLLDGKVPKDYLPQVHGSLYVTGRKRWRFLSYRRGFPALEVTVERDEEIMSKIATILSGFYGKFDEAMDKLRNR